MTSKLYSEVKCTCDLIKIVKKQRKSDHNTLRVFFNGIENTYSIARTPTWTRSTGVHQTKAFSKSSKWWQNQ